MTLNCFWWWGSSSGDLKNVVYLFIPLLPGQLWSVVVVLVKVSYMYQITRLKIIYIYIYIYQQNVLV